MKITFEAPYKKKEIIQCKRCQRFGHTKNQCFRPFRCVKCGNEHSTTQCIKKPDTEATCANCNEKHPASYKGCKIYKQYKERILKVAPKPKQKQPIMNLDNNRIDNSKSQHQFQQINSNKTYAEIAKTGSQTLPAQKNNDLNNMTDNDFNNFTNTMETARNTTTYYDYNSGKNDGQNVGPHGPVSQQPYKKMTPNLRVVT